MPARPFPVEVEAVAQSKSGMKTIVLTVDGVSYTVMLLDELAHIDLTSSLES